MFDTLMIHLCLVSAAVLAGTVVAVGAVGVVVVVVVMLALLKLLMFCLFAKLWGCPSKRVGAIKSAETAKVIQVSIAFSN